MLDHVKDVALHSYTVTEALLQRSSLTCRPEYVRPGRLLVSFPPRPAAAPNRWTRVNVVPEAPPITPLRIKRQPIGTMWRRVPHENVASDWLILAGATTTWHVCQWLNGSATVSDGRAALLTVTALFGTLAFSNRLCYDKAGRNEHLFSNNYF